MKVIEATMPDGSVWPVEVATVAYLVADHAVVLTPFESMEKDDRIFAAVYEPLLQNDSELLRLGSQLDWLALLRTSTLYSDKPAEAWERLRQAASYDEAWFAAPKRIVERERA